MADIQTNSRRKTTYGPLAATNRYIIGDFSEGALGARKVGVSIDLNGGTLTFTFQGRVPGSANWLDIRATPLSTGTVATGGTATENWQVDAEGLELAINVTVATGSPRFTWS